MEDKKKDEGDQALIRQQRRESGRGNGKPDPNVSDRREEPEDGGRRGAAPSAGGVTRPQEPRED